MKNIQVFLGLEKTVIKRKIDKLVSDYGADEYNRTVYDLEETPLSVALNDCLTPPFLSERKVVIMTYPAFLSKGVKLTPADKEFFMKFLSSPLSTTLAIFNGANVTVDPQKEETAALFKVAEVNQSPELNDAQVYAAILRYFTVREIRIDPSTVSLIQSLVGSDMENAANELEKIELYVMPAKAVTADDVRIVVIPEPIQDVFALTNALVSGSRREIISAYRAQRAAGKDAAQLFGLVSDALRSLWYASVIRSEHGTQDDLASLLSCSPGRAYHLLKDVSRLPKKRIEDDLIALAEMDASVKTGQKDLAAEFELFILGA